MSMILRLKYTNSISDGAAPAQLGELTALPDPVAVFKGTYF